MSRSACLESRHRFFISRLSILQLLSTLTGTFMDTQQFESVNISKVFFNESHKSTNEVGILLAVSFPNLLSLLIFTYDSVNPFKTFVQVESIHFRCNHTITFFMKKLKKRIK